MSTTYILSVDLCEEGSKDFEYVDKERAIKIAREYWDSGAYSVHVYHYTNYGQNCHTDYRAERD